MTTTYDPHHPSYADEADVRDELTRVFDVCGECRRCADACSSFTGLFDLLDRFDDVDAGRLTPLEQDRVVAGCSQCQRCVQVCPYPPDAHELAVDVSRLMVRARAMQHASGVRSLREQLGAWTTARPGLVGRVGSAAAGLVNRLVDARPGSTTRRVLAVATGVSATGRLPRFTSRRFSGWFRRRPTRRSGPSADAVHLFPTCWVEFGDTELGRDLVGLYERHGLGCSMSGVDCCGATALHTGDLARFRRIATRSVGRLADELDAGAAEIVVATAGCAHVIRHEYPRHVESARRRDAERVAARTVEATEHLVGLLRDGGLDPVGGGTTPERIVYVPPGRRGEGLPGADLLRLIGAEVEVVSERTGLDPTWGIRTGSEEAAARASDRLAAAVDAVGSDRVVAGCAGTGIGGCSAAGTCQVHPVSLLARAVGVEPG